MVEDGQRARPRSDRSGTGQAVLTGIVTAVVGFTSSFAVVLTGLRSVGASPDQAASGLLVVCVTMGLGSVLFSLRLRRPITMAWSTPGAALLVSLGRPGGGYADAVGAFVLVGVLYVLTGLVRPLARAVGAIPSALANAMLAGVLLTLVVVPFRALPDSPWAVGPVLLVWLLTLRFARRWAVPAAFVAALVVIAASGALGDVDPGRLAPRLTWTTPGFDLATAIAIGVPLYLVTMTSQNIPGVAIPATFGYDVPLRPVLAYTGAATVLTAGAGGYSINLSAITAALTSGPGAHPDPDRRWIAGLATGITYIAFGPLAATVSAVAVAAPEGVVATIAGVALIAAFGSALVAAVSDDAHRDAAALTFVVAASGLVIGGVGAAFWALLAGAAYLLVVRRRSPAGAHAR